MYYKSPKKEKISCYNIILNRDERTQLLVFYLCLSVFSSLSHWFTQKHTVCADTDDTYRQQTHIHKPASVSSTKKPRPTLTIILDVSGIAACMYTSHPMFTYIIACERVCVNVSVVCVCDCACVCVNVCVCVCVCVQLI